MSLGFTYYEPLFAEVFKVLIDQYGILPVVAIGNENHGNTSSPGNAHNAFSVGALECRLDGPPMEGSNNQWVILPSQKAGGSTDPRVNQPSALPYNNPHYDGWL